MATSTAAAGGGSAASASAAAVAVVEADGKIGDDLEDGGLMSSLPNSSSSAGAPSSTLDEPVSETIVRTACIHSVGVDIHGGV